MEHQGVVEFLPGFHAVLEVVEVLFGGNDVGFGNLSFLEESREVVDQLGRVKEWALLEG